MFGGISSSVHSFPPGITPREITSPPNPQLPANPTDAQAPSRMDRLEISMEAAQAFSLTTQSSQNSETGGLSATLNGSFSSSISIRVSVSSLQAADTARKDLEGLFKDLEGLIGKFRDSLANMKPKGSERGITARNPRAWLAHVLSVAKELNDLTDLVLRHFFKEMGKKYGCEDFCFDLSIDIQQTMEFAAEIREAYASADSVSLQSTSFGIQMSQTLSIRMEMAMEQADPIILDLDGNGIETLSVSQGVRFDITGDGNRERTGWVGPNDGLLAMDRNGNGIIDCGRELFGDQRGAANGFAELAKLDSNGDGRIDENDKAWGELRVWRDADTNGRCDPHELHTLSSLGIKWIDLQYADRSTPTPGGRITQTSRYGLDDGSTREAADILFDYTK